MLARLQRLRLKTPAFASACGEEAEGEGYPKPASMSAKRWELLQIDSLVPLRGGGRSRQLTLEEGSRPEFVARIA